MPKFMPGRLMTVEDEMIQDILEMPIKEIHAEMREEGLDPDQVAANLRKRLASAQETVIQRRLSTAKAQPKHQGSPTKPEQKPKTIEGAYTAEGLTMAARNATRPMGLSDPSVDEDLDDLDSDEWTRD